MLFEEHNGVELAELRDKVQKAAFAKQTFFIKEPPDYKPVPITIYNRIRTRATVPGKTVAPVEFKFDDKKKNNRLPDYFLVLDHIKKVDSFFDKYTDEIFCHKQLMRPEHRETLLDELKETTLFVTENFLLDRRFSKRTVNEILKILEKEELNTQKWRGQMENTHDFKGFAFLENTPYSHAWIKRENKVISEIRNLYKECTTLSDRQIRYSMALAFEATDFWFYDKKGTEQRIDRYQEKLKKRFDNIDKDRSKTFPRSRPNKQEVLLKCKC